MCLVAVGKLVELYRKGRLFGLLEILMCGKLVLYRKVLILKLSLDVYNGRFQELVYRFPYNGADVLALLQFAYPALHEVVIFGQLEVPVSYGLH